MGKKRISISEFESIDPVDQILGKKMKFDSTDESRRNLYRWFVISRVRTSSIPASGRHIVKNFNMIVFINVKNANNRLEYHRALVLGAYIRTGATLRILYVVLDLITGEVRPIESITRYRGSIHQYYHAIGMNDREIVAVVGAANSDEAYR